MEPRNREFTPFEETPTSKLAPLRDGKQNIVLYSIGSFSPVHYNHVDLLNVAKNHLEASGDKVVVGGFICPTADRFLRQKLVKKMTRKLLAHEDPPNFISGQDRCAMVDLILKDSDWIACDRYETMKESTAGEGKRHLEQILSEFYGAHVTSSESHVTLLGVSGIDALQNIKSINSIREILFVVNRKQDDGTDPRAILAQHPRGSRAQVVWSDDWETKEMSSTSLRKLWAEGRDISHITSPAVIEYLKNRGINFTLT